MEPLSPATLWPPDEAYHAYEEGKAALRHLGLTQDAYEAEARALAERLGI
jgi:hypothetical protein